jgi:hypothetical protein
MRLSSLASVRRLAQLWVDMSRVKRSELLNNLDEESRKAVVERMQEINLERKKRVDKA